jgi:phosphate-selective porin OprO/OprP
MKKRILAYATLTACFIFSGRPVAAEPFQQLLDKLTEKGVLTKEESKDLLSEKNKDKGQADKMPQLKLSGYMQLRYTYNENDEALESDSYLKGKYSDRDGFGIRRAYIILSGKLLPDLMFKLSGDIPTMNDYKSKDAAFTLRDAYVSYEPCVYGKLKAGQFKVPFGLEYPTSSTKLLTPNRSLVVNSLDPNRDIGLQLSGGVPNQILNYSLGIFNGAGSNHGNSNDPFMYVGRLEIGTPKDFTLAENSFLFKIGASGLRSEVEKGYKYIDDDSFAGRQIMWGMDAELDFAGLNLRAEYIKSNLDHQDIDEDTDKDGFYVQGAYFIIPKTLQAVAKYEEYDADTDEADNHDKRWTTLGLNYYLKGHDVILALNYIIKDESGDNLTDDTVFTQLQVRF